ncbi:MAG: hypothetical protein AAF902_23690, partial [Chloroflexota bacterium]
MANKIVLENQKLGNSPTEWDINGMGDPTIRHHPAAGFHSQSRVSVLHGAGRRPHRALLSRAGQA